jgi:hypothetical protein
MKANRYTNSQYPHIGMQIRMSPGLAKWERLASSTRIPEQIHQIVTKPGIS